MARAAWVSLLLVPALAWGYDAELDRRLKRADEGVWQAVFGVAAVNEARKQVGKPYAWGEKSGQRGFDCSGYSAFVFASLGVELPPDALGQFQKGISIEKAGLIPGDLVFFLGQQSPLHVGIFVGEGRFLHAPSTGKLIGEASLDEPYFSQRYVGARRYCPSLNEARVKRGLSRQYSVPSTLPLYKEKRP
jgi:hypothetical protein